MNTVHLVFVIQVVVTSCVIAEWSTWERGQAGLCSERCTRIVHFTRNCVRSNCFGNHEKLLTEACAVGHCRQAHGQWSFWEKTYTHTCKSTCRRLVWMFRWCASELLRGGPRCVGSPVTIFEEDCEDGMCAHDGMTNQKTGTTVQNNKRKGNEAKGKDEEAKDGTRKEKSDNAEKKGGNLKENITGNNHTENGLQNKTHGPAPVDGHWSSWKRLRTDRCDQTCKRSVEYGRTCTNSTPSGGGRECSGPPYTLEVESCSGDKCVTLATLINLNMTKIDGAWSEWSYTFTGSRCPFLCKREVLATRICNSPPPSETGLPCHGPSVYSVFEYCVGEECSKPHGQWSTWKTIRQTDCTRNCTRHVSMARQCVKRSLSVSTSLCQGKQPSKVVVKNCTGFGCGRGNLTLLIAAPGSGDKESQHFESQLLTILAVITCTVGLVLMVACAGVMRLKFIQNRSNRMEKRLEFFNN